MVAIPDVFLKRFIAMKKVSLQIGIAMLTGMYIMLALILVIVNGTEFNNNFSTQHYLLVAIIISITFIWLLAFFGAYMSSMTVIKFTFVFWTIFTIAWITLVIIRLAKGDKDLCVANQTRCAPTMWLFENGSASNSTDSSTSSKEMTSTMTKDEHSDETQKKNEDLRSTPEDTPPSPERYIMRTTESSATRAAAPSVGDRTSPSLSDVTGEASAASSAVTSEERLGATTGVTATREHPVRSTTRRRGHAVRIYQEKRKAPWNESVTAYVQGGGSPFTAVAGRERPSDHGDREAGGYGGAGGLTTTAEQGQAPSEEYYKYVPAVAYFLALYLYSWFVLLSYIVELKCVKSCTCQERHSVPT